MSHDQPGTHGASTPEGASSPHTLASDERLRVVRWLERRRQPMPTDDDALALFAQELIAFHPTSWQEEADCLTAALEVGSYLLSALDAAGRDGDDALRQLRAALVREALE